MNATMSKDLKLLALDEEDLMVVSAHIQDSVLRTADIVYNRNDGRLLLGINRFAWEASPARRLFSRKDERRRSLLQVDRVSALRSTGISQSDPDAVLSILTVSFLRSEGNDPSGTVTITCSGDAALQADVECIEVRLADQGGAWAARGRPRHGA
ncbi:MAG: DUF2948 family protein [Ahrensia sp.]|nr:DUF2948 family protein [Ahrensia sp.]